MREQDKPKVLEWKVLEPALIVTIFGIFFTLMFNRLSEVYRPYRLFITMTADQLILSFGRWILSIVPTAIFVLFSFYFITRYLFLLNQKELEPRWKDGCRYRSFAFWSGLRILVFGAAPLSIFYLLVFFLNLIIPDAFTPPQLFGWGSLTYFLIWSFLYCMERHGLTKRLLEDFGFICLTFVTVFMIFYSIPCIYPLHRVAIGLALIVPCFYLGLKMSGVVKTFYE